MDTMSCFWHNVSAEPALLLYAFVTFSYSAVMPNLIQQKVCSPDSPPSIDFVCNNTDFLDEATDIVTVRATLRQSLPTIILLIAGSWRDSTGLNKPIMFFALFCEIVGVCIQVFSYLVWTSSPWKTSIAEGIINGLGGGSSLFYIGSTCAITDNTKPEDRTSRLTFVYSSVAFSACLANGIFGYCLTLMGYTWYFIFIISLHVTSGVLVIIFVKDKKIKEKKGEMYQFLKQLLAAFKRRQNIMIIWFMIFASCSVTVVTLAEINIYQYYLHQTFSFTIEQTGLYLGYRMFVGSLGSIIVPPILIKLLKLSDFQIGIICSLITAVSCVSMVFATTTLEIELFALLDATKMFLCGLPKSIISKCVNEDEIGLFVSFCLVGESILPLFVYYIYDRIYHTTSKTLPGAFYLATATDFIILLIFYSISAYTFTPLKIYDEENKNVPEELDNCDKVPKLPETPDLVSKTN